MNAVDRSDESPTLQWRGAGTRGFTDLLRGTLNGAKRWVLDRTTGRLARRGSQNVYDREWDVLILLDCARVDMMEAVRDEYEFIGPVGEHVSVGTTSREWMEYTFTDEYAGAMADTLHVTANTSSDRVLDADDFLHLEEVWRDGWDSEHNTILPREVTDRAIALHREFDPERTIIHYMQPHPPFVPFPDVDATEVTGPGIEVEGSGGKNVQELSAVYSREELWEFHMENLRYVLDDLVVLLQNLAAADVVISADHGQALGEDGIWGHPGGSTLDSLRTVPWCKTTATDSGEYDPDYRVGEAAGTEEPELSVEEKLRHLGYKTDD